jgi:hypothetical protein
MKKIVCTTLVVSMALALTACSKSKTAATPIIPITPTTLEISGGAVKGTLISATVELFNANDLDTTIGESVQTGTDGSYTLTLTDDAGEQISGAYVVKITADDDSTMICDAAVTCGDVDRGESVPAAALAGLTLSSFTFADSTAEEAPAVNVNSLSTMATDAIISAAKVEGSAIDLTNLTQAKATALQVAGSEMVGAIIGVDLTDVDLFSLAIIDASVSADMSTTDPFASTLTLVNASLANINVLVGETIGNTLTSYFTAVNSITTAILEDPEIDLGATFSEQMTEINLVQANIATESADILTQVVLDTGNDVTVKVIPDQVDPETITDVIGNVTIGTGGTGATN